VRTSDMSTRVTYRHFSVAHEALETLFQHRNPNHKPSTRSQRSPAVALLQLCLSASTKILQEPGQCTGKDGLESRVIKVLRRASNEHAFATSLRVRYALAVLHFVERTLGLIPNHAPPGAHRSNGLRANVKHAFVMSEDRRRRQPFGTYSTPDFIVQAMLEDLFRSMQNQAAPSADVLDLSMEAGHFPLMCSALRPPALRLRFFGIDRDPFAVDIVNQIMRFALTDSEDRNYVIETTERDSLCDPLPQGWPQRFNAVIGNPPWRRDSDNGTQLFRARHSDLLRGHDEHYLAFILRAHQLVRPGGYLSYVVPSGFLFNTNGAPLRELLLKNYDIVSLRIYPQRSFVEVPCIIPVSFLARKRVGARPEVRVTRIAHHENVLGGPDRPRGVHSFPALPLWRKLPGNVFHPVARPDCDFLIDGLGHQKLQEFGSLCLGPRLVRAEGRRARHAFRAIRARHIRAFHVCLRAAPLLPPNEHHFKVAPKSNLIFAKKVVFQELRYMTHRRRLIAAVAGARTYPVSTASMFVPHHPRSTHFFAGLLNSALANAWYKLHDVSRSIKLDLLRNFPVVRNEKVWERISKLALACANFRRQLHRRLRTCAVPMEKQILGARFPGLYRRLRDCEREIDREVFELYGLSRAQRKAVAELAAARVF
jgi:hypothetical protein